MIFAEIGVFLQNGGRFDGCTVEMCMESNNEWRIVDDPAEMVEVLGNEMFLKALEEFIQKREKIEPDETREDL